MRHPVNINCRGKVFKKSIIQMMSEEQTEKHLKFMARWESYFTTL